MRLLSLSVLLVLLASGLTQAASAVDLGPLPGAHIECFEQSPDQGTIAVDPTADGDWRRFRRDGKLTGRSPLTGNITCPEVLWVKDLGVRKHWIAAVPGGGSQTQALPTAGSLGDPYQTRVDFEVDGLLLDLDGDGFVRVESSSAGVHKIGDFVPGVAGFERITCDPETVVDTDESLPCRLEHRQSGSWTPGWTSVPLGFTVNSNTSGRPIVGDFDNDGQQEVAVLPWYDLHVLDLATGNVEQTGNFHDRADNTVSGRGYGWLGAVDLDDEPRSEFVILGDLVPFVSVMGWAGQNLVELWDYHFALSADDHPTIHHPGVNPVADLDGDGYPEIATTVYNETVDGRWHVLVFDGRTGDIEADFPDSYLATLHDLDGDDVAELLITDTNGSIVPKFGSSRIVSLLGGTQTTRWSSASETFAMYEAPTLAETVNSSAYLFKRTAFVREDWAPGHAVFLTQQSLANGESVMRLRQFQAGDVVELGAVTAHDLAVEALPSAAPDRGILFRSTAGSLEQSTLSSSGVTVSIPFSGRVQLGDGPAAAFGSLLTATVVGRMTPGAMPTVVTQGYREELLAFQVPDGRLVPEEVWRRPGRGMASGEFNREVATVNGMGSVMLADLAGDGGLSVLAAVERSDESAALRALDATGNTMWEAPFPVAGEAPTFRQPGITNWTTGRFTSADRDDVIVSVHPEARNQLSLLRGLTGEILTTSTDGGRTGCAPEARQEPGSIHMGLLDWDGDGLDELLSMFASAYVVYDGNDLSIQHNRWRSDACDPAIQIFDQQLDYESALPVIEDLLGRGDEQVLYAKAPATTALLELNGDPIWQTPYYEGQLAMTMQGVGDFDGDGDLDVLVVGNCGVAGQELRAFEASTGALRWTAPLDVCEWPYPKAVTTGDIDGDGKDEALFTFANVLYAIGEDGAGQGRVLWQATYQDGILCCEYSYAVVADVDGSGRPQILVNTPAGYLFALGAPSPGVVSSVLPSSRSVSVGQTATLFATVISTGPVDATACSITPETDIPADFLFQTTNPATNELVGTVNTPVDVAGLQSFLLAFTPSAPFPPTEVNLRFDCTNTDWAPTFSGLNTVLLAASDTAVADIVALAATLANDGIVNVPGEAGTGIFATASINLGAQEAITVRADTGTASLPVTVTLCQTDPLTAACINPPAPADQVTYSAATNGTPTFSLFVTGSGPIPFDPARHRIFVRFEDDAGALRGSASVAVRTVAN